MFSTDLSGDGGGCCLMHENHKVKEEEGGECFLQSIIMVKGLDFGDTEVLYFYVWFVPM